LRITSFSVRPVVGEHFRHVVGDDSEECGGNCGCGLRFRLELDFRQRGGFALRGGWWSVVLRCLDGEGGGDEGGGETRRDE
jgi:hypothetical protein